MSGTDGPNSNNALGSKRFTAADYARARNKYQPRKIRLLFVAESPPSSGGFFYFAETIGKDHLFRETMKALDLWPLSRPMVKGLDKRPLLEQFRARGFFLIDTSAVPIDRLSLEERRHRIAHDATGLAARVRKLNPDSVAIIKKTVYKPVRDAIDQIGLGHKVLNAGPIPFPSHGNQRNYRTHLKRVINRVRTK